MRATWLNYLPLSAFKSLYVGSKLLLLNFAFPPQCGITLTDQSADSFTKHIPLNPDLLYKVGFILAFLLMNSLSSARFWSSLFVVKTRPWELEELTLQVGKMDKCGIVPAGRIKRHRWTVFQFFMTLHSSWMCFQYGFQVQWGKNASKPQIYFFFFLIWNHAYFLLWY